MALRSSCLAFLALAALSACANLDDPGELEGLLRAGEAERSLPGSAGAVDTAAGRNRIYRDAPRPYEFTDEEYRRSFPRGSRPE
jgi:hypothetical protein